MAQWALHMHGVGNASATMLGSSMATIEYEGEPWLTIDCGGEGLGAYMAHYGGVPKALFITHTHLDHIGGFERLFTSIWFGPLSGHRVRLYVPAPVVPLLHQRVADYPNVLAEGGVNFWDAFQLVPVSDAFWHEGVRLEVFPVRHHWPNTAFGLRLPGSLVWTGDTRPIPEILAKFADAGELIAHDCDWDGNPSHTGMTDLEREYSLELRQRMLLYHYANHEDGDRLAACGYRVARPNQTFALAAPILSMGQSCGGQGGGPAG
ncbi:MAG: MBL fold metallo-hydrolase [Xanthomonadaceae bacterium]|nr:MBL fold metallo-hydrolase [Xanthomonadaceae bacterium]